MLEGGAAEEVLRDVVHSRVVEHVEAIVALEVVVLVGLLHDGEVGTGVDGEADGVARVGSGEPLAHTYSRVGTQHTRHLDIVAKQIVQVPEVLVARSGFGTCQEDVGGLPVVRHRRVEGVTRRNAVDGFHLPPGQGAVGVMDAVVDEAVGRDVDGRSVVRLRQHNRATVDIDGAVVGP